MKRRLWSILTVLALCVSMMPVSAAAGSVDEGSTTPQGEVQGPSDSGNGDGGDNAGDNTGDGETPVPGDASNGLDLSNQTEDGIWTTTSTPEGSDEEETGIITYDAGAKKLTFDGIVRIEGGILLGNDETLDEAFEIEFKDCLVYIDNQAENGIGLEVKGKLTMLSESGQYASNRIHIAGEKTAILAHNDTYIKELALMVWNGSGESPVIENSGNMEVAGGELTVYTFDGTSYEWNYAFEPDAGEILVYGDLTFINCVCNSAHRINVVDGKFSQEATETKPDNVPFNLVYCAWMKVAGEYSVDTAGKFNGIVEQLPYNNATDAAQQPVIFTAYGSPSELTKVFADKLNTEIEALAEKGEVHVSISEKASLTIQTDATWNLSGVDSVDLSQGNLMVNGTLCLPKGGCDPTKFGNVMVAEGGKILVGNDELISVQYILGYPGGDNQGSTTEDKDRFSVKPQMLVPGEKATQPVLTEQPSSYTLDGWYTDATYSAKWDFDTPVTETMKLYGRWLKVSSSGSSSRPSKPTTPTNPTTPTTPENVTVTPNATVSTDGSAASVTFTPAMGNDLVKKAVDNKSQEVIIAPDINGDVSKTEVTVPAAALTDLAGKTAAVLTVKTPVAQVTLPNEALSGLAKDGGEVTVTAEKTDSGYQLTVTANGQNVSSVSGGVTMTVPHDDCAPGTVAVLVKEDGTREIIRKSLAGENSVTVPLDGSAQIELVDNSKSFQDVTGSSWEKDAVDFVSSHELFNGTSADTFSPDTAMTRGMVAQVLHNLEGNPAQSVSGVFTDVDGNIWYAQAVSWAADQGIVSGYGDGQFGAGDSVSRQDLAVILFRYSGSPETQEKTLDFTDAGAVSDYAKQALTWAVEEGILNGKGGGVLDPKGQATRAQVAQMLLNYMAAQ